MNTTKKFFAASAAALLLAQSLLTAHAATTKFQYGVWLPFWQSQNGAQDISLNLDSLTEISPFSYELNANGAILDDLKINNGSWAGWLSSVKDLGIKNIPTIAYFDPNGIHNLLSSTTSRRGLEDNIASLVKTQGFDGIDIDFESMSPKTRPYYSLFIQGLAQRLHPAGKKLTCTVVPRTPPDSLYPDGDIPKNLVYPENYTVLGQNCDEVRLMAYDQGPLDLKLDATKGNGKLYAPTADPDWVKKVIAQATPYIPAKKIMLGVPTYGYEYEVSWLGGITTYQRIRSFTYLQAMERLDAMGITPTRNTATQEMNFTFTSSTYIAGYPSLVNVVESPMEPKELIPYGGGNLSGNGTTTFFYVSFPDAQSTANEIALAKKLGLRGVVLFKADGMQDPLTWQVMK